jgi:hypothetical protein
MNRPAPRRVSDTPEGSVRLDIIERTLEAILTKIGKPVIVFDQATGKDESTTPAVAAARDGLLPVFLVAGEAVWREATGRGFGLELAPDRQALLGYRVARVGDGSFSTLMLSVMEATSQAEGPRAIHVNELGALWRDAMQRIEWARHVERQPAAAAPVMPTRGISIT